MKELRKLGRSFFYAGKGIGWAVRTQRNMRIHLTALVLVIVFGFVEGLSPTHWCLELLCCMAVISLELLNSALESACDAITREKNPLIGQAKDAAAGAVLVSAVGSVAAALVIFLGGGYVDAVRICCISHRWTMPLLVLLVILGAVFVFLPCRSANKMNEKK